jgi:protein-L-isoaspartate(D-aspartate) O-methyltransferase
MIGGPARPEARMPDWLLDQEGLTIVRRAYARQMLAHAGVRNDRLERAFAMIRREDFLGTDPWRLVQHPPVPPLAVNDPVYVYQDAVFTLAPERGVNNGSPSLHAKMLNDLAVEPAQHVAHIGAGAGYYTAMLAELTGASGRVTAIEFDETLAERARVNLAAWRHVTVISGDGDSALSESVDRVYVNFGVAAPAVSWIDNLKPDGKLLFALGVPHPNVRTKFPRHSARGATFLIERTTNGFAARWLYPAYFVCAEGSLAGDANAELALYQAFERGGFERVRSLCWNERSDPMRCWYCTPRWGLSFDALEAG